MVRNALNVAIANVDTEIVKGALHGNREIDAIAEMRAALYIVPAAAPPGLAAFCALLRTKA